MLIEVISTGKSTAAQARAYAEYRVFATLVRHSRLIQRVQVLLAPVGGGHGGDLVTCTVNVSVDHSRNVRSRATRPNAYSAVDHAAKRIGDLMTTESLKWLGEKNGSA